MKFLVDRMLGKLAKKLRMLGYDAVYYRGEDSDELIRMAREDGRKILTRNGEIRPKRPEDRVVRLLSDDPKLQLKWLFQAAHISFDPQKIFSRCLLCNVLIEGISRDEAEGKVPDFIFYQQKVFFRCPQCRRIYWEGSHPKSMQKGIEELLGGIAECGMKSGTDLSTVT